MMENYFEMLTMETAHIVNSVKTLIFIQTAIYMYICTDTTAYMTHVFSFTFKCNSQEIGLIPTSVLPFWV